MKNFSLLALSLLLNAVVMAAPQKTQDKIWVAKLSGQSQCEDRVIRRSNLGEAIGELEKVNSVNVEQAMVSRLKGRMFCSACHCPEGSYFIAQIKITPQTQNELEGGWELINAEQIAKLDPKSSEPVYTVQPEFPDR